MIAGKEYKLLVGIGVMGLTVLVSGSVADNGTIYSTIDRYLGLCIQLERITGGFECFHVRQLVFTHPSVIYCYSQMVVKKSLQPAAYLWQAYKGGMIVMDKQRFLLEFCHLIALIFEQFLIMLASDLTGQSPQSIVELLNKLHIDLLFDDLIVVLEQCYEQLSHIANDLNSQQVVPARKKIVAVLLTVASMIVARYLYKISKSSPSTAVEEAVVQVA